MKSIILQMVHNKVMGSVIDALEYYLVARRYSRDVYLVFVPYCCYASNTDYKKKITNVIKDKYINYPQDFEQGITILKKAQLLTSRIHILVILDWGSVIELKSFLHADKIIVVSELTNNKNLMINDKRDNVVYYGEMPFVYKDYQYRMKFGFDMYPKLDSVEDALYINSPNNDATDPRFLSYVHSTFPGKKVLVKSTKHKSNLFSHFDEYLYYHANKYFDPHPRLFHECYFYGKKIYYENPYGVKDGSYYRYKDLFETGLKDRILDKDDEIIQLLTRR